jgi:hypothetical protein
MGEYEMKMVQMIEGKELRKWLATNHDLHFSGKEQPFPVICSLIQILFEENTALKTRINELENKDA